ncbi:unnamed protein product, partial [Didymodactylos carnosus]
FVLSMYNAGATVPASASPGVVMGAALFYGGLIQLLAGLLEFRLASKFQNGDLKLQRAGGAFGILTASIAWYAAFASLLTKSTSRFTLPVYSLAYVEPEVTVHNMQL